MGPGEPTPTDGLPITSDLELSGLQWDMVRRHDLSPVMIDTLARVKAGGHTYPTRVRPLIRRGFVTEDGRRLTEAGESLAEGLGL